MQSQLNLGSKNFKKIVSYESVGSQDNEQYGKKYLSGASIGEYDYDQYLQKSGKRTSFDNKQSMSTMASFNSTNSMGSFGSMQSVNGTQCSQTQNSGSKSKNKVCPKKKVNGETDFRMKYKTEVCKYWAEYGFCQFGDQCAFAHGKDEIRQKLHISNNYKTKKCVQFHENGYCPYGVRCQFIHCLRKDTQLNPNLFSKNYGQDVETCEIWHNMDPDCSCMKRSRLRLRYFQKLQKEELVESDDSFTEDSLQFVKRYDRKPSENSSTDSHISALLSDEQSSDSSF